MPEELSHDIATRERELQELKAEIERLKTLHQDAADVADARNAFLAHVSHELRTPMNSILGMTRLALGTELSTEQRGYLEVINGSVEQVVTLVNDLLDQAKIDAGRLELETIPFRLDQLCETVSQTLESTAIHKDVAVRLHWDAEVPRTVVGDPTRLRQVLVNLMGNAVKFTEEGSVTLAVAAGPTDDTVQFTVEDTGIGIPTERQRAIFEQFEQADISTTRRYGGSGLGLSISQALVEMMGGAISVSSVVGEGSTFAFSARLPEAEDVDRTVTAGAARGGSVLLLTDQRLARTELVSTLADAGLTVDVVVTSDAALERLRPGDSAAASFSAIVVDVQRHGLEIAWELGRERRGIPMLLVTPGGNRGDAARCRELGISAYLTGPVVAADIVDAVEAIVAGADELVTRHWLKERRRTLYVLVADDSAANRTLVTEVLEQRGHHVVAASNGAEAVDAFESQVFDIVLLDLHMPDSDGYAASRLIRKLGSHGAAVPIVAVSGSVSDLGRRRASDAGMNEFLAKPYVPEALVEIVETLARVRQPAA